MTSVEINEIEKILAKKMTDIRANNSEKNTTKDKKTLKKKLTFLSASKTLSIITF